MNRFRFNVAPELGVSKVSVLAPELVKTILIRGLSSEINRAAVELKVEEIVGEKPVFVALYGKNILRPSMPLPVEAVGVDFDAGMAAVEFGSRSSMLRALLAIRAAAPNKIAGFVAPDRTLLYTDFYPHSYFYHCRADEAWKTVDPQVKRPEQLIKLAVLRKDSDSESRDIREKQTSRSRYDDKRYDDYDRHHRHRSRSRSHDRRYSRHRSRSRSPRSRRYH